MKKFFKKRWYVFVVAILVVAVFLGRNIWLSTSPSDEKTYKVKKQTLKEELAVSGQIDAQEKVTLRFQTSGRLTWVGVKTGDVVKKYQTVATLDKREIQEKLDKYLNTYLKERWDFEQTRDDYKDDVITTAFQRILDKSQFDLNNSVSDVEIQSLALEFANLFSPIEGIVTKVNSPHAGVNITPTQAEFEIINPKTIYFSASVDQTDVVKLSPQQKGSIIFDAYPEEEVGAMIESISYTPMAGETGTVYEIKISPDQIIDFGKYRLGMTGDVTFVLKEKANVLTIPLTYLKSEKNKKYVWQIIDKNKKKTFVETGEETSDDVEIINGLKENDVISQ